MNVSSYTVFFLLLGRCSHMAALCAGILSEIQEFDAQKAFENREHSEVLLTEEYTDSSHMNLVSDVHNKDTTKV